jgi:hypothetical protein
MLVCVGESQVSIAVYQQSGASGAMDKIVQKAYLHMLNTLETSGKLNFVAKEKIWLLPRAVRL